MTSDMWSCVSGTCPTATPPCSTGRRWPPPGTSSCRRTTSASTSRPTIPSGRTTRSSSRSQSGVVVRSRSWPCLSGAASLRRLRLFFLWHIWQFLGWAWNLEWTWVTSFENFPNIFDIFSFLPTYRVRYFFKKLPYYKNQNEAATDYRTFVFVPSLVSCSSATFVWPKLFFVCSNCIAGHASFLLSVV